MSKMTPPTTNFQSLTRKFSTSKKSRSFGGVQKGQEISKYKSRKFSKSKSSRNFLCPISQVELWGGGGGGIWHARWPLSHHQLKLWQENFLSKKSKKSRSFLSPKMSRNFLSPTSQVEFWGGGEEGMAYQISHHNLKDWQENFISPKKAIFFQQVKKFSKSNKSSWNCLSPTSQVEIWGGGGRYGIPDDTPPTTTSKIDKKMVISPKIQAIF